MMNKHDIDELEEHEKLPKPESPEVRRFMAMH